MILKDVLNKGIEILKDADIEAPVTEAGVILCFVLKCDRVFLYAHSDDTLDDACTSCFFEFIKMRAEGMPVQYITGHQEFMSLDFAVNSNVLIPRHDTEVLIETVIGFAAGCRPSAYGLNILDLGTGSGCIAVSLAYYIKGCHVTAVDISDGALKTACINAEKNGVKDRITFRKANLFEGLDEKYFDMIVSNPPYIPAGDVSGLQREVKDYEPLTALDGGLDGLDFYRAIIEEAPKFLKTDGFIAFEVGYNQACKVAELMSICCYAVGTAKDLNGIDRVVYGRLKA